MRDKARKDISFKSRHHEKTIKKKQTGKVCCHLGLSIQELLLLTGRSSPAMFSSSYSCNLPQSNNSSSWLICLSTHRTALPKYIYTMKHLPFCAVFVSATWVSSTIIVTRNTDLTSLFHCHSTAA